MSGHGERFFLKREERERNAYIGFCWNTSRKDHLKEANPDTRIILKCIFKKLDWVLLRKDIS
jgi:hypothetical protein